MIAHDGREMPQHISLDPNQKHQIRIYGQATIAPDGRMLTIFRHDLPMLEKRNPVREVKRSACN